MKKFVCVLLAALLCCVAMTAMAVKPGEEVKVNFTFAGDSKGAIAVGFSYTYDTSVLEFVSATNNASATDVNVYDPGTPLSGTLCTVTFKVKEGAEPGVYSISTSVYEAFDADMVDVTVSVAATSVTVDDIYCKDGEHDWKVVTDKEATCTDEGQETCTCTICGKVVVNTLEKIDHVEGEAQIVDPTCTEDGSKVVKCKTCDEYTFVDEVIPALGHDDSGDWTVIKEATCTEAGKEHLLCAREDCEEQLDSRDIPAKGHTEVKTEAVAATCEKTGLTEGVSCSVCKAEITKQEVIEKLPHNKDKKETDAADCESAGTVKYYCSMCGELQDTETVDAVGHTPEKVPGKAATCTEDGLTDGSKCSVCDKVLEEQKVIDKLGHTEEKIPAVEATCTEDGLTEGVKCSVCDEILTKQETVPAAHKPSEDATRVEPTCETAGSISYVCTVCGEAVDGEEIPALGHAWDEGTVTKAATCEEDGEIAYVCGNDETHTKTDVIPALGHDWSDWVVTVEPTEDAEGEQERTCATCGKVETEVIDNRQTYVMTLCSNGIRFRDLENPVTDYWYMFTPVDLSVEGTQEFDLIAGNIHRVGTVKVTVADGNVTVTYKLYNKKTVNVFEEYVSILPSLADVTALDDSLTAYAFGQPISIENDLGGDTKVLLFLRNRAYYVEGCEGVYYFDGNGKDYNAYVEDLKLLMD